MNIIWENKIEHEVNRYFYTAKVLLLKKYGKLLFYVLPYLPEGQERLSSVYFPRILDIPAPDWAFLKKKPNIGWGGYEKLISYEGVERYFAKNFNPSSHLDIKKDFDTHYPEFLKFLTAFFAKDKAPLYKAIHIYPVTTGTVSSYSLEKEDELLVYFRLDSDIAFLFEAILTGLLRRWFIAVSNMIREHYFDSVDFLIYEHLSDFLLSKTKLNTLFKNFKATTKAMDLSSNKKLLKESSAYLNELGMSTDPVLSVKDGAVWINGKNKFRALTGLESRVLLFLVINSNSTCLFDDIARVMWGDDFFDKFSLGAINKLIFQIRQKFRINGIFGVSIETRRTQGYILVQ